MLPPPLVPNLVTAMAFLCFIRCNANLQPLCSGLCTRHVTHTTWVSRFGKLEGGMTVCCQSGRRRGHYATSLEKKTDGMFYGLKQNRMVPLWGKESKKCVPKNVASCLPCTWPRVQPKCFLKLPFTRPSPTLGPRLAVISALNRVLPAPSVYRALSIAAGLGL